MLLNEYIQNTSIVRVNCVYRLLTSNSIHIELQLKLPHSATTRKEDTMYRQLCGSM